MEEGVGKAQIGFDIDETGPGDISHCVNDICLEDMISLFVNGQAQLG